LRAELALLTNMKTPFTGLVAAAALLVAFVSTAAGQEAAPATAYTGPRYPGGPDSLRALVQRSTRLTDAKAKDVVVLRVFLKDDRTPAGIKAIGDPYGPKSATGKATAAAIDYLQNRLAAWEAPAASADGTTGKSSTFLLPLNFAVPLAAQPYAYADQEPVFRYLTNSGRNPNGPSPDNNPDDAAVFARLEASPNNSLGAYVQRQTKYPMAALRNREQGRVLVYFEVAESGRIENAQIITSAGSALDAEVLRAVSSLLPATTPAMLQGRPVRVFYVVPSTFRMQ
jgi:TonB family protein